MTVRRIVVRLIEPSPGTLRFKLPGDAPINARPPKGKVQLVFQGPAESLDPPRRIGAIIAEPLQALAAERSEWRRRVREAVGLVRLDSTLLDVYPAELSAGQQQREGGASAMITEPDLVVLDEPTSALDPTARAETIALLKHTQAERNTAYLFISHDLSTIRFISHRVAVMYLAVIVEQGDAATLFTKPQHPYSSELLSSVLLPHPDVVMETSVSLKGEIPSPIDLPRGCFLASRYPFMIDRCRSEMVGPSYYIVHCFRHDEVAATTRASKTFDAFVAESERILRRAARQPIRFTPQS